MQFYLNGYRPGDPFIEEPHPSVPERGEGLPEEADVLIVGAGPAGLVLGAQLSSFPDIATVLVDRRAGPLAVGQADGVACRTVEMFEALGLADRLLKEAYWVNEVCFWRPDPARPAEIRRAGRVRDTEEGLSEFPHVIVNQARMLAYLRERMLRVRRPPGAAVRAAGERGRAHTRRRLRAPRNGHARAHRGATGHGEDVNHPRPVRRWLRWRAQRCPARDRP